MKYIAKIFDARTNKQVADIVINPHLDKIEGREIKVMKDAEEYMERYILSTIKKQYYTIEEK